MTRNLGRILSALLEELVHLIRRRSIGLDQLIRQLGLLSFDTRDLFRRLINLMDIGDDGDRFVRYSAGE